MYGFQRNSQTTSKVEKKIYVEEAPTPNLKQTDNIQKPTGLDGILWSSILIAIKITELKKEGSKCRCLTSLEAKSMYTKRTQKKQS